MLQSGACLDETTQPHVASPVDEAAHPYPAALLQIRELLYHYHTPTTFFLFLLFRY
jgi:hypothetical protein